MPVKEIGRLKWQDLLEPIQGLETGILNRVLVQREVVPIIFVPGIMGTRLKRNVAGADEQEWDPDGKTFMFMNYTWPGAAEKQRTLLFGENGAIDTSGLKSLSGRLEAQ